MPTRAFSRSKDEKTVARQATDTQINEKEYQAKVGRLTLEVDFLKGIAQKMLGSVWEGQLSYKK
jgi:hypothetical protein